MLLPRICVNVTKLNVDSGVRYNNDIATNQYHSDRLSEQETKNSVCSVCK